MRIHQGSAPSSCAPSSSSTSCCSSRVPRSSALLPILFVSYFAAHYVTLLSTVHICPRDTRTTATLSSRRPDRCQGWTKRSDGKSKSGGIKEEGERDGATIYCLAIVRRSRRGPHSVRSQRRASIGCLSPAERSPRVRAFVLAAAPTDAGLLQSVELSGELIFQRYWRRDGISWHRPPPLPPTSPTSRATTTATLHVGVQVGRSP